MARTRRLTELVSAVGDRLRLPPGDPVIALSGGADSAALAYLCVESGRQVRALHVNHGLAGADLMEKAAATIAEHLGLGLTVVSVTVSSGPSPEGQARAARYEAYAKATDDAPLLTGHTRDDHVETVVLNMVRGTGLRGLSGIPYHRPRNIYRPMLSVTRSETREIASLAGLGFVDDPMNEDPALTRNVLRRSILPSLRRLNPRLDEAIARMAALAGEDADFLDDMSGEIPVVRRDGASGVPIGSLLAVPQPLARRALVELLRDVGVEATEARVRLLWEVVAGQTWSHEVGGGVTVRRAGPLLVVSQDPSEPGAEDEVALAPGTVVWGNLEFDVVEHDRVCGAVSLSRWAAIFPRGTELAVGADGVVTADGRPAWAPGKKRLPVAWYEPGTIGYLSVFARETGWT